jgi:acyl-coenzyme A synthetase/AMP-(fatty) acid ligase
MMFADFLIRVFEENKEKDAIIWKDQTYTYEWLLERLFYWRDRLKNENIPQNAVVILEADFSPNSVALFLALVQFGHTLVPLTSSVEKQKKEFIDIAQGEVSVYINDEDEATITPLDNIAEHTFYKNLKNLKHPGLVLFSSGSTGKSKAAVHDLYGILEKFKVPRHNLRTITFLLYDHIGGINTMLYVLSNAGCIVAVQDRSPENVLKIIERYKVQLLPTSPTFINLILLSESYKKYDISSLQTITYGTEPMPENTLKRFNKLYPKIKMLQTYGLSELGILRSKSKSSDSLWVKIGGEGFATRVIDNILQIKAKSAMLGYLNAPSPFTEDGWFMTGDMVEVDGDYLKILGRKSEIINIGGEKVYPAEVESVILEIEGIAEVTVYGEKNPIMGSIVAAKITPTKPNEDTKAVIKRVKIYCREKLQAYKVPARIKIINEKQYSERFKKKRSS